MSANILWGNSAYSPDLSPLDFYLWRDLKTVAYWATTKNKDTLRQHIFYACQTICIRPGIFEKEQQSMVICAHACIDSGAGHFEHFLWILTW